MRLSAAWTSPILLFFAGAYGGFAAAEPQKPSGEPSAEELRASADLPAQRRHVWQVVESAIAGAKDLAPARFESWHGESEVFRRGGANVRYVTGVHGFLPTGSAESPLAVQTADSPVLMYALYNDAAFNHIRDHRLYSRPVLERLRSEGAPDAQVPGGRDIPQFPTEAIIVKTAWWPVSQLGVTALPVWDSEQGGAGQSGTGYLSWRRVVAVDPQASTKGVVAAIEFAGRSFKDVPRISTRDFYAIQLGPDLAARLMQDGTARKQAAVVLGRQLQAGDYLVLVGANLATRESHDWVWAALWWHDRPASGPYANDRPGALGSIWRNYLMQAAFDAVTPVSDDGSPHICFNPWLEGRFPDGGHGGGTVSNCLGCHARASYPPVKFLPVTRGAPQLSSDEAFQPGRLRTSSLWSIALHANP